MNEFSILHPYNRRGSVQTPALSDLILDESPLIANDEVNNQ